MAPVEPDTSNSNLQFLLGLAGFVVTLVGLLAYMGRVLYRAYTFLPPSQAVRVRQSNRRKHVQIFLVLSTVSLAVAIYHSLNSAIVSYDVWATERGVEIPKALWGEGGVFGGGDTNVPMQLGWWNRDISLVMEIWEIATERSRRFWWTQQALLSGTAWSVYLGIEGARRNIPHLWAFVILTQIVSVAFSQNLFCLAVLLTPTPLPEDGAHHISHHANKPPIPSPLSKVVRFSADSVGGQSRLDRFKAGFKTYLTPKPASWTPHPILHLIPLTISFICIFLTPFATNLKPFMLIVFLPQFHMYLHASLPHLAPASLGSSTLSAKATRDIYSFIFKFIAVASFLLHFKATVVALLDNTPDSHRHRHSILFFRQDEERTKFERGRTAIGNVIGAINDHPVVSHAGWDAILSGVTAIVWATIRGLDVTAMLHACVPYYQASKDVVKRKVSKLINGSKEGQPKSKGRPRTVENDSVTSTSSEKTPKRKKKEHTSIGEQDYTPDAKSASKKSEKTFVGEETENENPESGALAWGLIAVGGVGLGATGVWGSEAIANS